MTTTAAPTAPKAITTTTTADKPLVMSAAGQAQVDALRADRAQLEAEMILTKEDPFAALERRHKNAMAALPAIGAKSPLANAGKGPQAGDPGVGKVAEYVPVSVKC